MSFLHDFFINNNGRIINKWLHYFDIYERHFEKFRGKPITFLEIGLGHGGSLAMWKAYFGPDAKIIGLDIRDECLRFEDSADKIYIGSQTDKNTLGKIIADCGQIDIVLDDGSHIMQHMIRTFEVLYKHVSADGIYAIEDTGVIYSPKFGGGVDSKDTILEYTKGLMDRLYTLNRSDGTVVTDPFTLSTNSINVYDGMIVFEKRRRSQPQSIRTGAYPELGNRRLRPSRGKKTPNET